MKIVSANVNGLRAFDEKTGGNFNKFCTDDLQADIICLQEVKGTESSLSKYHSLVDYQTFSSFTKAGRHGVSTFVRKSLFCGKTEEILPGRILKTYHGGFVIYNCYMPFWDETREDDKSAVIEVYEKLRTCLEDKGVILCGDFNATYNMLDHYQYAAEIETLVAVDKWISHGDLLTRFREADLRGRPGEDGEGPVTAKMEEKLRMWKCLETTADEFLDPSILKTMVKKTRPSKIELSYHFFDLKELEDSFYSVYQRAWMRKLADDYVDTFRLFNSGLAQYTCWNVVFNLRPVNMGTRIDYILCSKDINCLKSGIMPEINGSDHCPTYAEFDLETCEDGGKNLVKRKNNLLSFLVR